MKPLIFVHIPKTAGTSLRVALTKHYGKKNILFDYGKNSEHTSRNIKKSFYDDNDIFKLQGCGAKLLAGHFYTKKYIGLSEINNVLSFIREPVDRVVSEFKHSQRHHNFSGTLLEFARISKNQNVISNFFNATPWQAYGFIGLAERYSESITLLNEQFDLRINSAHLNEAPKQQNVSLSASERSEFIALNHRDYVVYNQVLLDFEWRLRAKNGLCGYVFGAWNVDWENKEISGYAFYRDAQKSVEVIICINGCSTVVIANKLHKSMNKFGAPRAGYVGFSMNLESSEVMPIECSIKETGQPIYPSA